MYASNITKDVISVFKFLKEKQTNNAFATHFLDFWKEKLVVDLSLLYGKFKIFDGLFFIMGKKFVWIEYISLYKVC